MLYNKEEIIKMSNNLYKRDSIFKRIFTSIYNFFYNFEEEIENVCGYAAFIFFILLIIFIICTNLLNDSARDSEKYLKGEVNVLSWVADGKYKEAAEQTISYFEFSIGMVIFNLIMIGLMLFITSKSFLFILDKLSEFDYFKCKHDKCYVVDKFNLTEFIKDEYHVKDVIDRYNNKEYSVVYCESCSTKLLKDYGVSKKAIYEYNEREELIAKTRGFLHNNKVEEELMKDGIKKTEELFRYRKIEDI